jgi:hypothetical protein
MDITRLWLMSLKEYKMVLLASQSVNPSAGYSH